MNHINGLVTPDEQPDSVPQDVQHDVPEVPDKPSRGVQKARPKASQRALERVSEYLKAHSVRRNEITNELQWKRDGLVKMVTFQTLSTSLVKDGINISQVNLRNLLQSEFMPSFNPLQQYLDGLPAWDGRDHFEQLACYFSFANHDAQRFIVQFKKWFVRMLKCALTPSGFNKQVLVLVSEGQNLGKTWFLRWLLPEPLKRYYQENPDLRDKDARLAAAHCLIINFDELRSYLNDLGTFKSYISAKQGSIRKPYHADIEPLTRICSFVASTNDYDFIDDASGSVRYLCFEITALDYAYEQQVSLEQLWAQAFALMQDPDFNSDMTPAELEENSLNNHRYTDLSDAHAVLAKYLRKPLPGETPSYLTPTEVKARLSQEPAIAVLSAQALGRIMKTMLGPRKSCAPDNHKRYAAIVLKREAFFDLPDLKI